MTACKLDQTIIHYASKEENIVLFDVSMEINADGNTVHSHRSKILCYLMTVRKLTRTVIHSAPVDVKYGSIFCQTVLYYW